MKTTPSQTHRSTYSLLVDSEETGQSLAEMIAYSLFILSAVFSIWHVAQQPINLPGSPAVGRVPFVTSVHVSNGVQG